MTNKKYYVINDSYETQVNTKEEVEKYIKDALEDNEDVSSEVVFGYSKAEIKVTINEDSK